VARVFLSHSSRDNRQAVAVKAWLTEHEPGLAEEIFLDLDPHTGIQPRGAVEAGVAAGQQPLRGGDPLLSKHWEASYEPF
jgi:hypothetical protein